MNDRAKNLAASLLAMADTDDNAEQVRAELAALLGRTGTASLPKVPAALPYVEDFHERLFDMVSRPEAHSIAKTLEDAAKAAQATVAVAHILHADEVSSWDNEDGARSMLGGFYRGGLLRALDVLAWQAATSLDAFDDRVRRIYESQPARAAAPSEPEQLARFVESRVAERCAKPSPMTTPTTLPGGDAFAEAMAASADAPRDTSPLPPPDAAAFRRRMGGGKVDGRTREGRALRAASRQART